jgi:hypothetical protein
MLNKYCFYSKSFVISIRHHEMLKLGGTPCISDPGNADDLCNPEEADNPGDPVKLEDFTKLPDAGRLENPKNEKDLVKGFETRNAAEAPGSAETLTRADPVSA